jgi:hypothetical protein
MNNISFCIKKLEDETLDAEGRWNIPVIICEDRGFRDELKKPSTRRCNCRCRHNHYRGTLQWEWQEQAQPREVKDTLNGEESREEIQ